MKPEISSEDLVVVLAESLTVKFADVISVHPSVIASAVLSIARCAIEGYAPSTYERLCQKQCWQQYALHLYRLSHTKVTD